MSHSTDTAELEILPGLKTETLFNTSADYERFREEYIARVSPALERARQARAMSEHESRSRLVD